MTAAQKLRELADQVQKLAGGLDFDSHPTLVPVPGRSVKVGDVVEPDTTMRMTVEHIAVVSTKQRTPLLKFTGPTWFDDREVPMEFSFTAYEHDWVVVERSQAGQLCPCTKFTTEVRNQEGWCDCGHSYAEHTAGGGVCSVRQAVQA